MALLVATRSAAGRSNRLGVAVSQEWIDATKERRQTAGETRA